MESKPDEPEIHSSNVSQASPLPDDIRPGKSFGGAFIVTATLMPIAATLLTVAVYFAISQFSYSRLTSIASGVVLALIFWSVMAIFVSPRTTAERSDRYRYTLLLRRLRDLKVQLSILQIAIQQQDSAISSAQPNEVQLVPLNNVHAALTDSFYRLNDARPGADWAWGTGYVELSRNVHRADEALIMLMPESYVIELGNFLKAEVANSKISNPEQKLRSLEEALNDLDLIQNKSVKVSSKEVRSQSEARVTIRDVFHSLNEFEDDLQMREVNLVIALNRLTLLTGLALYILLIFAVLIGMPLSILISVTFFSLIGACTGLLGRLYEQVKANTAVDSTSLASVHLMAAPVLSGLAAIGGVALVQKVAATSGDFSFILTPFNILAAAAFGLAPNLFFNALQRQVDAINKGK